MHALKSAARLIGAAELSEAARVLEECGHKGDIKTIQKKTPALLELYRSYKEILRPYMGEEKKDKQQLSKELWLRYLSEIKEQMEQFDLDFVDGQMEQLKQYAVPKVIEEDMELLYAYVADVAMEDVMQLCQRMCDKLREESEA